jgi:hypothetical protein
VQLELGFQLYSKLSGYLLLLLVAEYDFVLMTFYDYKSFLYVVFLLCICYPFVRSLGIQVLFQLIHFLGYSSILPV